MCARVCVCARAGALSRFAEEFLHILAPSRLLWRGLLLFARAHLFLTFHSDFVFSHFACLRLFALILALAGVNLCPLFFSPHSQLNIFFS